MRPTILFSAVCIFAMSAPACNLNAPAAPEPTTTRASAVTAVQPDSVASADPRRNLNDVGSRPATPPPQQIPRPEALSASQHPGHFRNKTVDKPAPIVTGPPPPVPADYIAKQNDYLNQWRKLAPTLANLPPEEQSARRAALKRSVLGE